MTILVNNKIIEVSLPQNVTSILQTLLPDQQKGIAVAVNNEVIPKTNWQNHLVQENDRITIIHATQGG